MSTIKHHQFHIPVMGIGFTIDTPLKVAILGIDSVISIVDDALLEQMREFYSKSLGEIFIPIDKKSNDYRAKRIRDYLNLINRMVNKKFQEIKNEDFIKGSLISKYFDLLPNTSSLKEMYMNMLGEKDDALKAKSQSELRSQMRCGSIDVNIMAKVDTVNYDSKGEALPHIYNDAMSALRGYAESDLDSSIILSAGLNPRLYSYFEEFEDFFPNENNELKKRVVLKVSDYRSANIQGKILAKKGILVSEFRVESGLNCGGHAFATEGKLLGPILEEFKSNKEELHKELFDICQSALDAKERRQFTQLPTLKVSAQGGIGTANENTFLIENYELDSAGWGSPFLLVPEATNVDDETLEQLANARKEDYYLSGASPLGVPLNNFRSTSSQKLLNERIEKDRPGSPCYKKYLTFNSEFTDKAICTASRQYQHLKLKELDEADISPEKRESEKNKVLEKECLCEGLSVAPLLVNDATKPKQLKAVSICPGPNLAYFSGKISLKDMIDHIYGRTVVLNSLNREHMFFNELEMYITYLKGELEGKMEQLTQKQNRYYNGFKTALLEGVDYYKGLFSRMKIESEEFRQNSVKSLEAWEKKILNIKIPATS